MTTPVQTNAAASGIALVGAVVTTLANFGIAYFVSQGATGVAGAFFVATAVATIAGNGLSLGTGTGLVYFMPRALEGDHRPAALVRTAVGPVLVASVIAALIIAFLASTFADLVSDDFTDEITTLVLWFAPTVPAWALTVALLGATRGLGSMTPTVVIGQILRPGLQLVLIGILYIGDEPATWQIGAAWAAPVVIALVASVAAVVALGGGAGHGRSSVSSREFWSYTRPRSVSNLLQIGLERVDVIFVSALLGTEASGTYGALTRFIAAGNFLVFAMAQASVVTMRRAIAATDMTRAATLLRQTTAWLIIVAWPYFLVVALKPEPLARLLNESYVPDAGFLTVLALGMMVSAAAGPIDATLLMLGRSTLSLVGVVAAIATDIALLFALAPEFGLGGAAAAWAISVVVQNGLATWFVRQLSGLTVISSAWFAACALAVIAVVPVALVTGDEFSSLVVVGLVAAAIGGAGILRFRRLFALDQLIRSRRVA